MKQNKDKYIQVGICGIAEDKEFNEELGLPTKEIKRTKLAEFIRYKLNTNKIGFARQANVCPATVTKWLFTDAVPSMEMAKQLCRRFDLTLEQVDELFGVAKQLCRRFDLTLEQVDELFGVAKQKPIKNN